MSSKKFWLWEFKPLGMIIGGGPGLLILGLFKYCVEIPLPLNKNKVCKNV